ncbi:alpha/beta hydrolase [Nocardiopsis sediminis]|uniref:Alpha/beta hydrolase n=1 Tax=Nocardiopsis sediminis TaxID=1778267 RepID=A0ABV8FLR8_9ACTN
MHAPSTLVRSSLALTVLAALAGCAPSTASEPSAPAGEAPEGLEDFYTQQLAFEPCAPYAATDTQAETFADERFECARLEVPLDYDDPEGRTAQIALLRVPARGEGEAQGSLLLNPGGPGVAGMGYATAVADMLGDNPITEEFDLIGFDPRGVGASTPSLDCFTDAERDEGVMTTTLSSGADSWTEEETQQVYEACAQRSEGADVLANIGTRDVARDMDVLRAVLGDEGLNFAGTSYGTRLGTIYAETFPGKVRALVLDGAMDPDTGTAERRAVQYSGFQRTFEEMAAFCAEEQGADCPLGTDPDRATEEFQQIMQPLLDEPVPTEDGRELTHTAAIDGVIAGLYAQQNWPSLLDAIAQVREGRGDLLMVTRDQYHQRGADGVYTNFSEALLAIDCLDEQRHTPEEETAMKREVFEVAPFMDTGRPVEARNTCEAWPVEPTLDYPYATDIDEDLPAPLVVSVTRDPATPHEGGISLAEKLGGHLLPVEGSQHGVSLVTGNTCVDDIVAEYLIDLTPPPADAGCEI